MATEQELAEARAMYAPEMGPPAPEYPEYGPPAPPPPGPSAVYGPEATPNELKTAETIGKLEQMFRHGPPRPAPFRPQPFRSLQGYDEQIARADTAAHPAAMKIEADLQARIARIEGSDWAPDLKAGAKERARAYADEQLVELGGPTQQLYRERAQHAVTPRGRQETIGTINNDLRMREAEEGAILQGSKAEQYGGEAELYDDAVEDSRAVEAFYNAEEQRRGEYVDNALLQYKDALDEFRRAKPATMESYMAKRPGGMLLAGIAMALGAFGAALTGTDNFAMKMIEKGLDAEIRAQEQAIDQQRIYAGSKLNIVNQMRARLKDSRIARYAARKALADQLLMEVTSGQKKGMAERAGIQGQYLVDGLSKLKQKYDMELFDQLMSAHEKEQAERFQLYRRSLGGRPKRPTTLQGVPLKKGEIPIFDPNTGDAYIISAQSELSREELKGLRELISTHSTENVNLNRAIEIAKSGLSRYAELNGEQRRALSQNVALVITPYIKYMSGAQVTDKEHNRVYKTLTGVGDDVDSVASVIESMLSDPGEGQALVQGLGAFQDYRGRQVGDYLKTYGAIPAQVELGPDPDDPSTQVYHRRYGTKPRAKLKDRPDSTVVNAPKQGRKSTSTSMPTPRRSVDKAVKQYGLRD